MDLVIFHHHLLPGGVTSVITQGVEALGAHSRRISRIRVVAGRVPEPAPLPEGAEIIRMPEIDYSPPGPLDRVFRETRARRLADALMEKFGGGGPVWWIHNFHLGKNPLFTEAILRVAEAPNAPRLILQPHDFPEAGRQANLRALEAVVRRPLYPLGPRVRYALINRRDLQLLKEAGVPASRLFLLENPVSAPREAATHAEDARAVRSRLLPDSDPRDPTLLYPVRSIRRKNVLEAGMLLRLVEAPLRLLVTLPGVSRPETAYSGIVQEAFRSGLIHGEFGTGVQRPEVSVGQLAAACDMVVSSSVQEGFGYLFIHALQWGRPLLARQLDTVPDPGGLYDGYPASFYSGFLCPVAPDERAALMSRYRDKVRRLARLAHAGVVEKLERELLQVFARDEVDFSFLDPPLQVKLLAAAAQRSDFRAEVQRLNSGLAESLQSFLSEHPTDRIKEVDRLFGPVAYASRVDEMLDSFDKPPSDAAVGGHTDVQENMRAAFLNARHLRLLFD
jgi:hypothetical protein